MSKYRGKEDKKQCVICGGKYVPDHVTQKYCGNVCRKEQDRLRTRARRNKMTKEQKDKHKQVQSIYAKKKVRENKPKKVCLMCSNEFKANENGAKYKYCSEHCAKEIRKIRKRDKFRE